MRLLKNLKEIAKVDWHFTIQDTSNQDEHAIKYFGHCIEHTALSPKVKGQLKQKRLIMSGNVLKVMTSNDIERNHFDKVCNGSLVKAFRKCGFDIDKVVFETDDSSSYDDLASLEAHIQEEDEKVLVKQLKKLKNQSRKSETTR